MTETIYLSLKLAQASKTGQRSTGKISYRVLADELHQDLFITIVGNEGGGWFSNEIIPLLRIESVFESYEADKPLPSKVFTRAFNSKSANNAGFLVAVLRAEGLLTAAAEGSRLHLVTDEWELWKSMMLTETGEVYVPPVAKGIVAKAEKIAEPNVDIAESASNTRLKLKVSKKATNNATVDDVKPIALAEIEVEPDAESELDDEILEDVDADNIEPN